MIDHFSCMNCSRSYTSGQSQAAKTPVQVGKAVTSGILFGSVNVVLNRGRYFQLSKNKYVDFCPGCKTWHSTCPTCDSRRSFDAVQMFAPVVCGDCGLSYGVP